ncbi:Integrase, catalytic core [Gossypium australe]|uniref:Integrase, catalytic core n=1 Tax=Gossypium australe TaxID=47621 RepID=A0A5B6W6L4_9ROSI|nr:Integrase, catalytic core [Gossypium australe]
MGFTSRLWDKLHYALGAKLNFIKHQNDTLRGIIWLKGKLSSRFIGFYEILERIELVAYQIALPSKLEKIHNVFHVSMLQRYRSDPSHVLSPNEIELQLDLMYNEESIKILAREVKYLKNKRVALVNVMWHCHGTEEAT